MLRFIAAFIAALLAAAPLALAEFVTVKIRTVGTGATQNQAILEGVEEAVKRVYGFYIKSNKESRTLYSETNGSFTYKAKLKEQVKQRFQGVINGYKVLKLWRGADGFYRAKVEVNVIRYKLPGFHSEKLRRIAVYPFGGTYGKEFSSKLENLLMQSRRFAVLDREHLSYYKKEKALITSEDADKKEKAKLKKLAGADYLLIGELKEFRIEKVPADKFLKIETTPKYRVRYTIDYKVLLFANNQVKYGKSVSGTFTVEANSLDEARDKALNRLARRVVNDLILDIYPPVAILAEGDRVVVNVGNQLAYPGECFNVYLKGEPIRDPYTGEFLGFNEIKIGKVGITEVKPKFSVAKVLEGFVVKGAILRPCKGGVQEQKFGKSTVRILPQGGVVLPFDKR
ncbi:CsgG/HfaB family protein [Thermovibrio ammonificans]|uniref:Curli production assembly/transport component CsgG n=1 Tax=Thermovibrio ammonificans (strain DSM 15698 / JCM 12110 / HB-1) TaxID=648996 RepID=E8T2P1_THEA1|nr:CsgG/HfaB family protein [Thermovibrio ammonificans]ADU97136.1 hypothetical protein Theam_1172 [Thermovibrio ammonificans HB-1]